jgi:hypothetical protein
MVLGNFFYVLRVEEGSMSQSVQRSAEGESRGQSLPVKCKFCRRTIPQGAHEWHREKRACSHPDCFGRQVLEDQEAWEYEQYLDGLIVYGYEY